MVSRQEWATYTSGVTYRAPLTGAFACPRPARPVPPR